MSDNELINIFERCTKTLMCNFDREDCPYAIYVDCHDRVEKNVLDLIKHQQAEIKWLKEALQTQTDILESGANSNEFCFEEDKIRAEAIKEFAEKLITNIKEHYKRTAHGYSIAGWNYSVSDIEAFVHSLVKQMEERNERTSFGSSC